MSRLFIIGNAFDFMHGFPTKYSYFKDYVYSKFDRGKIDFNEGCPPLPHSIIGNHGVEYDISEVSCFLAYMIEKTGVAGDDWCNFEESLKYFDLQEAYEKENPYTYSNYIVTIHSKSY